MCIGMHADELGKVGDCGGSRGVYMSMKRTYGHSGGMGAWIWAWMFTTSTTTSFNDFIHSSIKVIKLIYSVRINCLVYL